MGDFEMDLIIGAAPNEAILTLTDRKTDFAIIEPLTLGRKAKPLSKTLIKRVAYLKRRGQIHSITTDNGAEFMAFDLIEKALKIPVYFARPYKATDKPHIEHLNALIRQYLPKGTSFKDLSRKEIIQIEQKLNTRPRKKLNFKTPIEVFLLNL
jgi:IS30 family transposase